MRKEKVHWNSASVQQNPMKIKSDFVMLCVLKEFHFLYSTVRKNEGAALTALCCYVKVTQRDSHLLNHSPKSCLSECSDLFCMTASSRYRKYFTVFFTLINQIDKHTFEIIKCNFIFTLVSKMSHVKLSKLNVITKCRNVTER